MQEVTVTIPLTPGTRAKDLAVSILKKKISASLKSDSSSPFITGELFASTVTDDNTWTVVDQKELVITLEKSNKQEWWPHVVTSAPKIDVRRIQPENAKLSDLDPDTRQSVEKMMFDQKQKQQGLPTSDELRKQELLEKFKSQHPELDFSGANIEM